MGAPVEFRDKDTLIEAWKLHNSPYFGIFQGKDLKFTNEDDDMVNAEDLLDKNLEYLQKAGTTAIYTLRVYHKPPVTAKADYKGSMTFRFSEFDVVPMRGRNGDDNFYVINQGTKSPAVSGTPSTTEQKLDKLIELLTLQMQMQMQSDDAEIEEEEDDEPEETEEEKIQRKIQTWTNIGSQIGATVIPLLTDVLDRFFPKRNSLNQNISGTMQDQATISDEQVQQAISNIMQALGDAEFRRVMVGLSNMATNNPGQLQMLAKMVN